MKYAEAKELYNIAKDEKALNALIEFFEYYKNNQNALYYIADCFYELKRFNEGIEYVMPKIDEKVFSHQRFCLILSKLIKEQIEITDVEEKREFVNLLKELWAKSGQLAYLSAYGFACRKVDCSQDYLVLLDTINDERLLNNTYIKNAKIWCIYDTYIKPFNTSDEKTSNNNVNIFLDKARYIVDNCNQLELEKYYNNPYGLTVIKTVKLLTKRASINYTSVVEWLLRLDVDMLPLDDTNMYTTNFGKEIEMASSREFYYYQLAKTYEKLEEYEKCIEICDKALDEDIKLHYRNHIWLRARKGFCECKISDDIDKAINNYKSLVDKYDFWFMKHKLASIYMANNMVNEALIYNCKAFDSHQEDKKLVNIIHDIGYILDGLQLTDGAKAFFSAYISIRNQNSWTINSDLEYKALLYNIDINYSAPIDKRKIKTLCDTVLAKISHQEERYYGKVKNIIANGKSGFITSNSIGDIFFNISQVKDGFCIKQGDYVEFEIGNNQKGDMAINIKIKEINNG